MGKTKAVNLVIPLTKMGKRKRRRSGVDDSTRRVYLLFIKGAVPGNKGGLVIVNPAKKKPVSK